jgi:hypothetical protein
MALTAEAAETAATMAVAGWRVAEAAAEAVVVAKAQAAETQEARRAAEVAAKGARQAPELVVVRAQDQALLQVAHRSGRARCPREPSGHSHGG